MTGARRRVLVADDDAVARAVLAATMTSTGADVTATADVEVVARTLAAGGLDVALVRRGLRDVDGGVLDRLLAGGWPRPRVVLALLGPDDPEPFVEADDPLAGGADAAVRTPASPVAVVDLFDQLLEVPA